MKKEEIHFGDISRWLFGEAPPAFMIEVFLRTIFIFLCLLVIMRLLGKRMSGQVTVTELSVMVTLGAIVSPVMQLPDKGILFGVVVLICALIFQRRLNLWAVKDEKVQHLSEGVMSLLIKDGVIDLENLEKTRITKQQLFSMLREKKIRNLARVKRGYLEACGILSIFETDEDIPGLPVFPHTDPEVAVTLNELDNSMMACCNCGHVQQVVSKEVACEICTARDWSKAYVENHQYH